MGEEEYGGIPNPAAAHDPGTTYYLDRDGVSTRTSKPLVGDDHFDWRVIAQLRLALDGLADDSPAHDPPLRIGVREDVIKLVRAVASSEPGLLLLLEEPQAEIHETSISEVGE